jgi:hypothetical protein
MGKTAKINYERIKKTVILHPAWLSLFSNISKKSQGNLLLIVPLPWKNIDSIQKIKLIIHFSCGFRGKQGRRFLSLAVFLPTVQPLC